jgi:hypothetical protein
MPWLRRSRSRQQRSSKKIETAAMSFRQDPVFPRYLMIDTQAAAAVTNDFMRHIYRSVDAEASAAASPLRVRFCIADMPHVCSILSIFGF